MAEDEPEKSTNELRGDVNQLCFDAEDLEARLIQLTRTSGTAVANDWHQLRGEFVGLTADVKQFNDDAKELEKKLEIKVNTRDFYLGLGLAGLGIVALPFSFMALTGAAALIVTGAGAVSTVGGTVLAGKDVPDVTRREILKRRLVNAKSDVDVALERLRVAHMVYAQRVSAPLPFE